MTGKLVGYKRFTSKNGRDLCVANVVIPYTPAENGRGSVGSDVKEIFLPDHQVNMLTEKDIGKDVEMFYTISGTRAYLENMVVK